MHSVDFRYCFQSKNYGRVIMQVVQKRISFQEIIFQCQTFPVALQFLELTLCNKWLKSFTRAIKCRFWVGFFFFAVAVILPQDEPVWKNFEICGEEKWVYRMNSCVFWLAAKQTKHATCFLNPVFDKDVELLWLLLLFPGYHEAVKMYQLVAC